MLKRVLAVTVVLAWSFGDAGREPAHVVEGVAAGLSGWSGRIGRALESGQLFVRDADGVHDQEAPVEARGGVAGVLEASHAPAFLQGGGRVGIAGELEDLPSTLADACRATRR